MKVLQINAFCGFGSTGKIAVDIAKSLPLEDECYIAYGYFNTKYGKNYKYNVYHNVLLLIYHKDML